MALDPRINNSVFTGIRFGINEDSPQMRLRNFSQRGAGINPGQFAGRLQDNMRVLSRRVIRNYALGLTRRIREEFIAGGHNRTGETLKTLSVDVVGLNAVIKMGGGGPFVEYRQPPHVIEAKNAQALFWEDADHPVKSVNHPGYAGDDFIGRAVKTEDIHRMLSRLAYDTFAEQFGMGDWQGPLMPEEA